jgi:multidrug efflux pump subunit AcrB
VAAPIEQSVNGVEGMLHMASRCTNDGAYKLTVTFRHGMNLNTAQVLVQNRVSLAEPALPEAVRSAGVSIKKAIPGPLALAVVHSSEVEHDVVFLGDLANGALRDRLLHVPGVGEVTTIGRGSLEARFWCDINRLAAFDVRPAEVGRVVASAKPGPDVANDPAVERPQKPPLARLADVEALGQRVVKTFENGNIVRLADLGRVELGQRATTWANLNGRPMVALVIRPTRDAEANSETGAVLTALRTEVAGAASTVPEGVRVELLGLLEPAPGSEQNVTPAPISVAELELPVMMPRNDVRSTVERCGAMARTVPGVARTLALSCPLGDPTREQPILLLELTPECVRSERRRAVHTAIERLWGEEMPGLAYRIGRAGTQPAFTIALCDRGGRGLDALRAQADQVVSALSHGPELANARVDRGAEPIPRIVLEVDRPKAAALGIAPETVVASARVAFEPIVFGVEPPAASSSFTAWPRDDRSGGLEAILRTPVANDAGRRVPLSALALVRQQLVPGEINRLDGEPMIAIRAEPAPDATPAQARAACDRLMRSLALPGGYRLVRLPDAE